MRYDPEDMELLEKFNETFTVRASSMAIQTVTLNSYASIDYEDTEVYGETVLLDFHLQDAYNTHVHSIENPHDDEVNIIQFARRWREAGCPSSYEEDKNNFFD